MLLERLGSVSKTMLKNCDANQDFQSRTIAVRLSSSRRARVGSRASRLSDTSVFAAKGSSLHLGKGGLLLQVLEGAVGVVTDHAAGARQIFYQCIPGDTVQVPSCPAKPVHMRLVALVNSYVRYISRADHEVNYSDLLASAVELERTQIYKRLNMLGSGAAKTRLNLFLHDLCSRYSSLQAEDQVTFPCSLDMVADSLQITIEYSCRLMAELREASDIKYERRHITMSRT